MNDFTQKGVLMMNRIILILLQMIVLVSAKAIISTTQYELHTPYSTTDMRTSFKLKIQNGTRLSIKEYSWPNNTIMLINDSIYVNDTSFVIKSINDTFIAYKDTFYIFPKKQITVQDSTVPQRVEIISPDFYVDISEWENSNKLSRSSELSDILGNCFGDKNWYFFFDGSITDQIRNGLGGPPNPIINVDSMIFKTESFRSGSAMEKVAIFIDRSTNSMAIGLICFYDSPQRESAVRPQKR